MGCRDGLGVELRTAAVLVFLVVNFHSLLNLKERNNSTREGANREENILTKRKQCCCCYYCVGWTC
jgi:hypothetical protein